MAVYEPVCAVSRALFAISRYIFRLGTPPLSLGLLFIWIADDSAQIPIVGAWLESSFNSCAAACHEISDWFHSAAMEFDAWWVEKSNIWDDLSTLWNYSYGWLKDTASAALSWAVIAYNWALEALNKVNAIAGVIGTTFEQIVQFIKDHAEIIYQTINEYITNVYETINEYITNVYETFVEDIYNTYNTFKEYITNVYETINNVFNTYVTNIIGVAEDWVRDYVSAVLAPFVAPVNLVNLWFDSIQNFFNDPLGWLWGRFADWFLGPEK